LEALEDRSLLSASIAGTMFQDLAGDGISADDRPTPNWVVNLYRDNGDGTFDVASDAFVARQTTGRDGGYEFRGLAAGTHFVQEELPRDWMQTVPAPAAERDLVITPAEACAPAPERNDTLATVVATGLDSATPGRYVANGVIGDNPHVSDPLDVDMYRFR